MLTALLSLHVYVICTSLFTKVRAIDIIPEAFQSFTFGGKTGDDSGTAVAADQAGNIYVAGSTSSKNEEEFGDLYIPAVRNTDPADKQTQGADQGFGPASTKANFVTSEDSSQNPSESSARSTEHRAEDESADAFLAKFNSDGSTEWARRFGSEKMDVVTSIVYNHGKIYVGGSTFGSADSKYTPDGTGDLMMMAFKEDGTPFWNQPLQTGSGGQDSIEAMAIDSKSSLDGHIFCSYIYITGRVGGSIFRPAQQMTKDENECSCRGGKPEDQYLQLPVPIMTHPTKDNKSSSTLTSSPLPSPAMSANLNSTNGTVLKQSGKTFPSELIDSSDMFVAKVNPSDGSIIDAVQLPLQFENSGDSIRVFGGKVYVSVNSNSNSSIVPHQNSALLIFCAEDLSYRTVFPVGNFSNTGERVQAMDVDSNGDIYLAGQSLFSKKGKKKQGASFFVRKYSSITKRYAWETKLGSETKSMVRSKASIAFGVQNNQLYVTGHSLGFFYESIDANRASNSVRTAYSKQSKIMQETLGPPASGLPSGIVQMGLSVISALTGEEVITWNKLVSFPKEFEDIQSMALDQYENVIFTGKRLKKDKSGWAACLGSFGSHHFSLSANARANMESSAATSGESGKILNDSEERGLGTLIIGLIVMAASISLMSVASVFIMTRSFILGQRHISGQPDQGFTYEYHQSGDLSKYEQNAQRAYVADGSEVLYGERAFSNGSGVIRRAGSEVSRDTPGGSAAPA